MPRKQEFFSDFGSPPRAEGFWNIEGSSETPCPLKIRRLKLRLTLTSVARKVGISVLVLDKIEVGRVTPEEALSKDQLAVYRTLLKLPG